MATFSDDHSFLPVHPHGRGGIFSRCVRVTIHQRRGFGTVILHGDPLVIDWQSDTILYRKDTTSMVLINRSEKCQVAPVRSMAL